MCLWASSVSCDSEPANLVASPRTAGPSFSWLGRSDNVLKMEAEFSDDTSSSSWWKNETD